MFLFFLLGISRAAEAKNETEQYQKLVHEVKKLTKEVNYLKNLLQQIQGVQLLSSNYRSQYFKPPHIRSNKPPQGGGELDRRPSLDLSDDDDKSDSDKSDFDFDDLFPPFFNRKSNAKPPIWGGYPVFPRPPIKEEESDDDKHQSSEDEKDKPSSGLDDLRPPFGDLPFIFNEKKHK